MSHAIDTTARVNGQPLRPDGAEPPAEELRQRACTELLRQAAQQAGLLDAADAPALDGAISQAASEAIERLLEREIHCLSPPTRPAAATMPRTRRAIASASGCRCGTSCSPSRRGWMCVRFASVPRQRRLRALPRRPCHRRFRTGRSSAVQLLQRRPGRRAGLADGRGLRPRVRPRAVRPCRDRRAATPGAQPLRPARGGGAVARARPRAGLRVLSNAPCAWPCASRPM